MKETEPAADNSGNGEFSFSGENRSCHVCPLTLLPRDVWGRLLRPPFKKRHPLIWWGGFAALLLLAAIGVKSFFATSDGDDGKERLALVKITGPILDVSSTLSWIRKAGSSPNVKGILLRVDSPGGGAAASQEVYAALRRLGTKIPIAVSMGSTAASGGLMVSMAGKRIFANPSTITGSIGVRMDIPQLQGLMGKLGIGQETLVTAPYKDATSYTHPMTPEDRAYLEKLLMNMHDQFVGIVATGRNMPLEKARELANGKIYTGQEALQLGLIDELGGQEEAHAWLAEQTGVPITRKLMVKPNSRSFLLEQLLALGKTFGLDLEAIGQSQSLGFTQPAFLY